jgi:hypothetical protein
MALLLGVESFWSSLSFVYHFYNTLNFVLDPTESEVKKFAMNTCDHLTNVKHTFGSAEVQAMWDALDEKYGGVQHPENRYWR